MSALAGKRILVTRPRAQAGALCDRLSARGAEPVLFPTIQIAPMEDHTCLDYAVSRLAAYHWLIFTSVNGVAVFLERLAATGQSPEEVRGRRIAAIGPATAEALERHGMAAELVPDEYVAEAIVDGIGDIAGQWILLPRADIAREALADELGRRGAVVHEIAVYRTLPEVPDPQGLAELRHGVDAITFTSSSTVRNFLHLLRQANGPAPLSSIVAQAAIACIGPITAQTARDLGLRVDVQANVYTMDGLVEALEAHFAVPQAQGKED